MHRQTRDARGRFYPNHPKHRRINPYEALDANHFATLYQALDNLNHPAFELLENNLYFLFGTLEEDPFSVATHQGPMQGIAGGANPPPGEGNPPPPPINPTFKLPISDLHDNAYLKNILASSLPKFYGLVTEDPDTFLFGFDVLHRSYDYTIDAHRQNISYYFERVFFEIVYESTE